MTVERIVDKLYDLYSSIQDCHAVWPVYSSFFIDLLNLTGMLFPKLKIAYKIACTLINIYSPFAVHFRLNYSFDP